MQMFHELAGKMTSAWDDSCGAIVDTWQHYFVSLAEFKEAIMVKGVDEARLRRADAWIVDSSAAKGALPQEVQDFIGTTAFKRFAEIGIKYFITISSTSTVTNMSIKSYASKAGPFGLQLVEVSSLEQARAWLGQQKRKAA